MGLVGRVQAGAAVLYSCWYAPGAGGLIYDVVRIPSGPRVAALNTATAIVAGSGYPLDPVYDVTTDAVTLRYQGGCEPEFTRHARADFAVGDLSRPTATIVTPDSPPAHQGFASIGDRFFFYIGEATDAVGGDPVLITEYSWKSGAVVNTPIGALRNVRLPDGTYPGDRMLPEGAMIEVDGSGVKLLVVGVTIRVGAAPRTYPNFRCPFEPAWGRSTAFNGVDRP